jgi:F-type H+-transporting ATPase subunit delta
MPNPRLAHRYAKSLIDLATEKGELETVYADVKYLQSVCKSSNEFMLLLKSPIVTADKKQNILNAITAGKTGNIINLFTKLLVSKGRESELPEIAEAFIEQYNQLKGINKVKLSTAVAISDEVKKSIEDKVKAEQTFGSVELETAVDESLIGGFVLEFNNNLVDASIARDLRDVKKQFEKNLFVRAI